MEKYINSMYAQIYTSFLDQKNIYIRNTYQVGTFINGHVFVSKITTIN